MANDEVERIYKQALVMYMHFKVIYLHLPGETKENLSIANLPTEILTRMLRIRSMNWSSKLREMLLSRVMRLTCIQKYLRRTFASC
jgi:hypothetical protein